MLDDPIAILTSTRAAQPDPARPYLWPLIIIMLMLLAAAIGFFGKQETPAVVVTSPTVSETPERDARVYTVSYRFGVFSPTNLRIHAGDTVRFHNDGPIAIRIVASVQPSQKLPEFDSVGKVQPGSYFSYTFATVGVFDYYNDADQNQAGVIIVR